MSGFRSPALSSPAIPGRPPLSRTPAGRKDGGIKLLDITEQPLGYAAAKKRKKMQEVEDAAKKASEVQQTNVTTSGASTTTPSATPDYAVGLTTTPSYAPSTPQPTTGKFLNYVLFKKTFLKIIYFSNVRSIDFLMTC